MASIEYAVSFAFVPTLNVQAFNAILNSVKTSLGELGKDIKPIDEVALKAQLSAFQSDAGQAFKGVKDDSDKAGESVAGLGKKARTAADDAGFLNKAFQFNQIVQSVSMVSSAFAQITQAGVEYESSLAAVGAITGFTGDNLNVLGEKARALALEFGGSATTQLASFQGVLSKLGPAIANDSAALELFGKNINTLSAASGDDAATSMTAITDTMLQLGLATGTAMEQAQNSTLVINALAAGAQVGAAEIPQVAAAMTQAGVAAKGANLDLVAMNAAIQVLAVGGKTGSEAGVALRNVLGLIQKASGPAADMMQRLGTSTEELGRLLTTQGFDVAMARLSDGMNRLGSDAEKNAALMTIFGTENASAAGILMQNLDKYKEFSEGIAAGMEGTGSAFEQAAQRMDTAEGTISRAKAFINDLQISFSQAIGTTASAVISVAAQTAPLVATLAALGQILPVERMTQFGLTMLSSVFPSLVTTNAETGALALNTEALTLANIKAMAAEKAHAIAKGLQTAVTWAAVGAQGALNAAFLASPIGWIVLGIAGLAAGLVYLYNKVDSVKQFFDELWEVIALGFQTAWTLIKSAGEAMLTIGGIIFSYITAPFQIAWKVISSVASALGGLIAGLFSTGEAAESSGGMLKTVGSVFEWIVDKVNMFLSTLKCAQAFVSSIIGSIGDTVGSLFTLDFSGAWDSFWGAGDKAAKAYSEAFQKELDAKNWEKSTDKIAEALEKGSEFKVKINAQGNFADLLSEYEKTKAKIDELSAKRDSGIISNTELDELAKLEAAAKKSAAAIGKLAPETRENFKTTVDAAGNLAESWDINISKAKEYNASTAAQSGQAAAAKEMSDALATQADIINRKKMAQIELQTQIDKETDPKKREELKKQYSEQAEAIKGNGAAFEESFKRAAAAGLVADEMLQTVAAQMGITSDEARKMALSEALKDASGKGAVTESQIKNIAAQFGVSADEARKMLDEQKKNTKEAEATAAAAMSIGDAYEESAKKAKAAAAQSASNIAGARLEIKKLEKELRDGTSAQPADVVKKRIAELNEQIAAEKKAGAENVKIYKEQGAALENAEYEIGAKTRTAKKGEEDKSLAQSIKLREESIKALQKTEQERAKIEIEELKKSNETTLKNQNITVQERIKLVTENTEKLVQAQYAAEINALDENYYSAIKAKQESIINTLGSYKGNEAALKAYQAEYLAALNNMTLSDAEREQTLVELNKSALAKMLANGKVSAAERAAANDALLAVEQSQNATYNSKKAAADAEYNQRKTEGASEAIAKIQAEENKRQQEIYKIRLGFIEGSSEAEIAERLRLNKELLKLDYAALLSKPASERNEYDTAKYQEYLNKIAALDTESLDKQKRAKIALITDVAECERELALYEAQKTFESEQAKSAQSASAQLAAFVVFNDKKLAIEQEYALKSNATLRTATAAYNAFFDAFQFPDTSEEDEKRRQQARNAVAAATDGYESELKALRKSLDKKEISLKEYQEKEYELTKKHNKEIAELNKDLQEKSFGEKFVQSFNSGLSAAAKAIATESSASFAKAKTDYRSYSSAATALSAKITAGEYKNQAEKEALLRQQGEAEKAALDARDAMYMQSAMAVGAAGAQALADGKNIGKAMVEMAFSQMQAMVPIWTTSILGQELASKGLPGLATSAALTMALMVAVNATKSLVMGLLGYRTGGYTGERGESDVAGVVHGREFVMNAASTRINRKDFEIINERRLSLDEYVRAFRPDIFEKVIDVPRFKSVAHLEQLEQGAVRLSEIPFSSFRSEKRIEIERTQTRLVERLLSEQRLSEKRIAERDAKIDRLERQLIKLNRETKINTNETKKLRTSIQHRINVEFSGEMRANGDDMECRRLGAKRKKLAKM